MILDLNLIDGRFARIYYTGGPIDTILTAYLTVKTLEDKSLILYIEVEYSNEMGVPDYILNIMFKTLRNALVTKYKNNDFHFKKWDSEDIISPVVRYVLN